MADGPEYAVQKILKHRAVRFAAEDDQFDFLIKWAYYEDPSCTKRDHVPKELITRYFRRLYRRSARAKHPSMTHGTALDTADIA